MKGQQGFTLLEVMIVVVIVAILTAIAVPAYSEYVTRGRLAEAYATLGGQRVRMEQFYQEQGSEWGDFAERICRYQIEIMESFGPPLARPRLPKPPTMEGQ